MIDPHEPAFPTEMETNTLYTGLTKRELFAAMAMQGILVANWPQGPKDDANCSSAHYSVMIADALIAELNKEPPK